MCLESRSAVAGGRGAGQEETLGSDGYVRYPDCGDDSMGTHKRQNGSSCTF